MEDSHIHDLPDCALEFCRAAGDTIPSFAQQKRPPPDSRGRFWGTPSVGDVGAFLGKRDQFLMWMARF